MAMKRDYDHLFKLVLVGNSGSGKSAILLRFADDAFTSTYISTIGVDFRFRTQTLGSTTCKLQIWDTAGQERFRTITSAYYRGAHAIIVCFDITNRMSFESIGHWFDEIHRHCNESVVLMLVGTKLDLSEERTVSKIEATNYAKQMRISYWETSAKDSTNIEYMFIDLVEELLLNKAVQREPLYSKNNNIKIKVSDLKRMKVLITKDQSRLLDRWKGDGICLEINLTETDSYIQKLLTDEKQMDTINELITLISSKVGIVEWEIMNYGKKRLFDEIIKYVDKLKICNIISPLKKNDALIRDNRLYGIAISKVNVFECDIDNELLEDFITNKYPYKLWDKFISNLKNNKHLEYVHLHISNECINNSLNVKKFVDILKCMEKIDAIITTFKLSFEGDTKLEYESHNDSVLKHLLYTSIIKCIKAKSKSLIEIELKYENKDSLFHLFDSKFCTQLLECKYPNLVKLGLYLTETHWNHTNLASVCKLINNSVGLQHLSINTKLFGKHFDIKNDTKTIELLSNNIRMNDLCNVSISEFSTESVDCCFSSLIKIINSNNVNVSLSFESLKPKQLYLMIDSWINRSYELYQYYIQIKDCLKCLDCNDTIKNTIFKYCQLKQYKLNIDIPSMHQEMNKKMFLFHEYLFEGLKELLINQQECSSDATHDFIVSKLQEISKTISGRGDVNVHINNECLMIDVHEYEQKKMDFIVNQDHCFLCYGYIRNISQINNVYIPSPLYGLIFNFYPKYDVFQVEFVDGDRNSTKLIKHKVSAVCDNTKFWRYDNETYFKSLNNIWYQLDDSINVADMVPFDKEDEEDMLLLSKKGVNTDSHCYIDIVAGNGGFGGIKFCCTNNGDVFDRDNLEEEMIFNAATFLIDDKNKHYMIDILISETPHVLLLTSAGNVFSFGDNDKGQCGVKNDDELIITNEDVQDAIMVPYHLRKLSENVIKSIHCGKDYSFCLDKDDKLYCFGHNNDNKMGLNHNKYTEDIIWEAIVHDFFNKNINGRVVKKIECGNDFISYIDDKNQCYWSPPFDDKNTNGIDIFHWQSSQDNKYKYIEIKYCIFANEDNDGNDINALILIDTLDRYKLCLDYKQDLEFCKIHQLDTDYVIESCFYGDESVIIITKKRL